MQKNRKIYFVKVQSKHEPTTLMLNSLSTHGLKIRKLKTNKSSDYLLQVQRSKHTKLKQITEPNFQQISLYFVAIF